MKVEVAGKIVELPDDYDPRKTNEEYMCINHRAYFKNILQNWLKELEVELSADISGIDKDIRSVDESDKMAIEAETLQELRRKDRLRKLIAKIEENINKIDQDTYGFCEESGEEIGINRLIMRPIARYCVEIQERKEQDEKEIEFLEYNQDADTRAFMDDDDVKEKNEDD